MTIALSTEGFVGAGAGDSTPPAITVVSPTPNTAPGASGGFSADYLVAKITPIVVDITDSDGAANLAYVNIQALFLDGSVEPAYRNASFVGRYVAKSSQSSISGGRQISLARDVGWPGESVVALAVGLQVDVIDGGGNLTSQTLYWQLPPVSTAAPAPAVSIASGAIDHVLAALSRLPEQFKAKATS